MRIVELLTTRRAESLSLAVYRRFALTGSRYAAAGVDIDARAAAPVPRESGASIYVHAPLPGGRRRILGSLPAGPFELIEGGDGLRGRPMQRVGGIVASGSHAIGYEPTLRFFRTPRRFGLRRRDPVSTSGDKN